LLRASIHATESNSTTPAEPASAVNTTAHLDRFGDRYGAPAAGRSCLMETGLPDAAYTLVAAGDGTASLYQAEPDDAADS
jgi:hypothetical protein